MYEICLYWADRGNRRSPRFVLTSLFEGGMYTSRVNPIDHQRTELFYHFYFADPKRETEIEDTIARDLAVVREYLGICIETHKYYASNAYSAGPLSSRHEAGVAYFQTRLKQSLGIG